MKKRLYAFLITATLCFPSIGAMAWWQSIQQVTASIAGKSMVTPILFIGTGPSTTIVQYSGVIGQGTWSSTNSIRDIPTPIALSVSGLVVRFPTALTSTQTYNIDLMVNGVLSSPQVGCQITSAATTCTSANTVTTSAADLLEWRSTPANTPNAQTAVQISAIATSISNGESYVMMGPSIGPATTGNSFYGFTTYSSTPPTVSDANVASLVPTNGVFDNLYLVAQNAPGLAKSYVFAVLKNGIATGLTCTLTGTGTGAGITTCNDLLGITGHSFSVTGGDTISLQATAAGTPTSGTIRASMRWVPTIPGEAIASVVADGATSTSTARFMSLNGSFINTIETGVYQIAPSIFTVKKLFAAEDIVPGGAANRVINLRANVASPGGGPSCTITSAATTCNDPTNTYTTATNDLLDLLETPNTTPAAIAYIKAAAVLYTP